VQTSLYVDLPKVDPALLNELLARDEEETEPVPFLDGRSIY
jgi:hypothetical protein